MPYILIAAVAFGAVFFASSGVSTTIRYVIIGGVIYFVYTRMKGN